MVTRIFKKLFEHKGNQGSKCIYNGPQFISEKLKIWREEQGVRLLIIQPGKQIKNSFYQKENGSIRKEMLDTYLFFTFDEVRNLAKQ
jgi:putative transposase